MNAVRRALKWLATTVRDPASGDASSARILAVLIGVTTCVVAVWSVANKYDASATITALGGTGVCSVLSRVKSEIAK